VPYCAMTTEYAPAERADPQAIAAANRAIVSSAILVTILDALPEQVLVLNRQRQIVYGNRAAMALAASLDCASMLGMRPGELLACRTALESVSGCGTAEACRTCGAVQAVLDAVAGQRSDKECRINRQANFGPEALDLRVSATPFKWGDEEYVLFVANDIADEKRRQVLERVFFHDILNTAGGISSMAGMLSAGDIAFDEVKDDLAKASDTLVQEIKSQRILVAAESNALAVQWTALESGAFLDAVVQTFRNHDVARDKSLRIAPGSVRCPFVSDEALLARVVGNLVKNALEASGAGEVVTLACQADDASITFICHNQQAMPRTVQLQVFQRSFSTKGRDRGIGTYSIKLLTEKYLGGKASFVSDEGQGTTFSVTLPRRAAPRA
jgi:nitrogen fixation/metabolism regulation signal transduction histidine kinase